MSEWQDEIWRLIQAKMVDMQAQLAKEIEEMGEFFKEYEGEPREEGESSGPRFLRTDGKKLLVENEVPFLVVKCNQEKTEFGPQFVLLIELEDGEQHKLGFAIGSNVKSRDHQLKALEAHLNNDGVAPRCKMVMGGKAYLLVDADA